MNTGGSPMRQESIGGTPAQTRSERVLEQPNEPPISEGHTSGTKEGRMEHTVEFPDTVPPTPHYSPLTGGYTPGSDEDEEEPSMDIEDSYKQGRMIEELDKDEDVILRNTSKDKGKDIMQETELSKKIKKREMIQLSLNEELAQKLYAEELAKEAARQEHEKAFSKAEVRKNMCMYLKNQGGYKQSYFKGMKYEDIRPIFERSLDTRVQSGQPVMIREEDDGISVAMDPKYDWVPSDFNLWLFIATEWEEVYLGGTTLVEKTCNNDKNLSDKVLLEHEKEDEFMVVVANETLRGRGGESFWEGGDDFEVDVLRFRTCLTDILGFIEKLEWCFEQDINNEKERFEEDEDGGEV
nr:hypothetical protein [Tanacetum cinerariifolium]